jgi:hypothetical protein
LRRSRAAQRSTVLDPERWFTGPRPTAPDTKAEIRDWQQSRMDMGTGPAYADASLASTAPLAGRNSI